VAREEKTSGGDECKKGLVFQMGELTKESVWVNGGQSTLRRKVRL